MPPVSAGIMLYRRQSGALEVLLVHPGGPFWRNRDEGAWMIPKGAVEPGEEIEAAAIREFEEELGSRPVGTLEFLARVRQSGGKWVEAYALEGDLDPDAIVSNEFVCEYPPKSGTLRSFPEVDRAAWFSMAAAQAKILPSQSPLLDALLAKLDGTGVVRATQSA